MSASGPAVARAVARVPVVAVVCASLVGAGCASYAPAPAEEGGAPASDFAREGAYAGLYMIQAYEDFDTSGTGVDVDDSDLGVGAKVGYRLAPEFAVEVVGENVQGFEIESGNVDADLDLTNLGVMGKYYILTDRIQPYLVGGFGLASADVNHYDYDDDGGFFRGGVGADFYLTSNFALFGELNYNWMGGDVSDLDHLDFHLGLMFRF